MEAFSYWKKLADVGIFQDGVFGTAWGDISTPFADGRVAMFCGGSYCKGVMLEGIRDPTTKADGWPVAFPEVTSSNRPWIASVGPGHLATMAKDSKHPYEAWAVLKTLLIYEDVLAEYAPIVIYYDSGLENETLLTKATNPEQVKACKEFEWSVWKAPTVLEIWEYPEVLDAATAVVVGIGTGAITAEEGMEEVQAVWNQVMARKSAR